MHVIDDKNDMFKDKPIDDRGVPEILFDIAAEVDQVAPLAGLGALEGEVRGGHRQGCDPGRGRKALAAQAPGDAVQRYHYDTSSDMKRTSLNIPTSFTTP